MVVTRREDVKIGQGTALVGIDVGMESNVCRFRAVFGKESKPLSFGHGQTEYERFWAESQRFALEQGCCDVVYGYESTGVYGAPLAWFLARKGAKVVQVNPMHVKKAKEITDNSPNKTDKKDPRVVLDVLQMGRFLTVVIPTAEAGELRAMTNARERLLARRTELYNQLHALVFMVFPELLKLVGNIRTKTVRHLLTLCVLPCDVVTLGQAQLAAELRRVSRGRKGAQQAQQLFEAAKVSVGVASGAASIKQEIDIVLAEVEMVEQHIGELERSMRQTVAKLPLYELFRSIRGLGTLTIAALLGEVGSFSDFSRLREIMKFAGLNLFELSSGKHQGRRRISKRGRNYMRKFLFFAAMVMARKGGVFHDIYNRHLANGMKRTQALTALARRLLGILFSMARSGTIFDESKLTSDKQLSKAAAA
jgi:transposase